MKKYPNILFLMTDEHRFDISGFMHNKIVRTPNLDKIAENAVVFDNAYCHNPICVPGRQCMLAGQYSTTCGCTKWGEDLKENYITFPRVFSQYGYETVAAGKLHLIGKDQMQGFTRRIGAEMHVESDYIDDKKVVYNPPISMKWSQQKEALRAGVGASFYTKEDRYALEGMLMFIDKYFVSADYDRATPENPVMLKLSLNQPHYPYFTDEEKFSYYLNRVKLYENNQVFDDEFLSMFEANVSERDMLRTVSAYYGMIETADDYFGRVVKALEDVGQDLDDWIIVYTSDHGEMLGEHGVMEKQKFFEGSVRVPLFIRYTKRFSQKRVKENVSILDIYATLCELCSLETPNDLDSRSLTNVMSGDSSNWDNEVISQFNGTNIMIKRDDLKYHYYKNTNKEYLFDLSKDKDENIDFLNDAYYKDFIDYCNKRIKQIGF